MTDVVVSIVSHSNRDLVLRCLEALVPPRTSRYIQEVVVLDNGSRDGSVEALTEHSQGLECPVTSA